jgi:hypothetical protein
MRTAFAQKLCSRLALTVFILLLMLPIHARSAPMLQHTALVSAASQYRWSTGNREQEGQSGL